MRLKMVDIEPNKEHVAVLTIKDLDSGSIRKASAYQCVYVIANGTAIEGVELTYRGLGTDFQGNRVDIHVKMNNKLRKKVKVLVEAKEQKGKKNV